MARKKSRGKRGFTIPLAPVAGVAGLAMVGRPSSPSHTLLNDLLAGDHVQLAADVGENFLGMDANGKFHADWVIRGWTPLAIGVGVHILASKFGANRILAQTRLPIRI